MGRVIHSHECRFNPVVTRLSRSRHGRLLLGVLDGLHRVKMADVGDTSTLVDAFAHSAWANLVLLDACRVLTDDQLRSTAPGFGSILATFEHLLSSDVGYASCMGSPRVAWSEDELAVADLDELASRAEIAAQRWQELLSGLDAERVLLLDDGRYEVRAGVVIAQALHHGSIHRGQVSAALTALGVEPPDIQPWAYADDTGISTSHAPRD